MRLSRLEIQGFKTFAQKTVFTFPEQKAGEGELTVVVGPNGSGKSNVADAIRWVLGEQSTKLLRIKTGEDVIFSGAEGRARSGIADVRLTLEEAGEGEAKTATIARRLDRDGQSTYELNGELVRLADVALFLATHGIAQRSYAVIGQGMIDHVLIASPSERKVFFDEACGVRPFQLRREQALRKMEETARHLDRARLVLNELEPRFATLQKQVDRLTQKETLAQELQTLEGAWYGSEWKRVRHDVRLVEGELRTITQEETRMETRLREAAIVPSDETLVKPQQSENHLERTLSTLRAARSAVRDTRAEVETQLAVALATNVRSWSPLPLSTIIERVRNFEKNTRLLAESAVSLASDELRARLVHAADQLTKLLQELERPASVAVSVDDAGVRTRLDELLREDERLKQEEQRAQEELTRFKEAFRLEHADALTRERQRAALEHERFALERRRSEVMVRLARLEERRAALLAEVERLAPTLRDQLESVADRASDAIDPAMPHLLARLRSQVEWIGSIPPETLVEHETTRVRVEDLRGQTEDIEKSLQDLHTLVAELDSTIREKRTHAFHRLNEAFGSSVRELFGGGEARLVEVAREPELDPDTGELGEREGEGIEIFATPPGKRLKSITLLSGGERALVSIGLICAILLTNPSPFVVLDEVDAALDEANARRFGELLARMAKTTQLVVITHNRATMTQASVLYGVSMSEGGVSKVLSLTL